MERWQGKVAVVTGASSGIGLATAKQLVRHGLIVIGLARRVDKMMDEMKDAEGPGEFQAKQSDITVENNVIETFDWIKRTFKLLHILCNSAVFLKINKIEDTSTEELENTFKVNVFGLLFCTKQAIKMMRENQTDCHIINVNSTAGHTIPVMQNIFFNVYPASKFAVTALSKSLRNELTNSKIRVTSISPGPVKTEMVNSIIKVPTYDKMKFLEADDVAISIMHAIGAPPHVEINEITLQPRRM